MGKHQQLQTFIDDHPRSVKRVVDLSPEDDLLLQLDFTAANTELSAADITDTIIFTAWVRKKLVDNDSRYGIGGYMEHRTLYERSEIFNTDEEPRRLHLGVDIWADAGTPVYAAFNGTIHSFSHNDNFGDYGPTIILQHNLDGLTLFSLYGHLSRTNLKGLFIGKEIIAGELIGNFGTNEENGHWPPHLHFQLMFDMEGWYGDYPGVGYYSKKDQYLQNIPDPGLVLQFPDEIIL